MNLRAARAEDAPSLSDIAYAAKAHWGYPFEWMTLWSDELKIRPAQIAAWFFRVAEVDGEAVGLCAVSARDGGRAGELEHLWVHPRHIGEGLGKALLWAAMDHCAQAGYARLHIVADPHAVDFYRYCGAQEVGEVDSEPAPRRLPVLLMSISR